MDYQTFRPVTKPSYRQHKTNFAEHNYNYVYGPKTTKTNTNTQKIAQNQNITQSISNSVNFHDQPRSSQEQSKNYPFFQQNKNNTNKYHTKKQPHYYAQNYFPSDDEEYYNQNYQQIYLSQRPRSYTIDHPDIFKPYTRNEQIRQPRNDPTPHNNNFQQQNLVNTQSYQPTQMHNEIPLPFYLQQHEITKSQVTIFPQMPHTEESLQMTMNPYLMVGSSIRSNKPLMVFTGTDPEYSVEDYLNAVTANLILNMGPEPINTPLHQN